MAESGINSRSEQSVKIKDGWLNSNPNGTIDIRNLRPRVAFNTTRIPRSGPGGTFEPRGVSFDGAKSGGSTDLTAESGFLNHRKKSQGHFSSARLACGVIHPISIHAIRVNNTTARGITLYA